MLKGQDSKKCENFEIASYIDGDFSHIEEFEFENHLETCGDCTKRVSEQRRLLSAMNFAFNDPKEEFEIPKNFVNTVVTRAESNVNGLRCPKERRNALLYSLILLLLIFVGIGESRFRVFDFSQKLIENTFWVFGFAGHFLYDAASGIGSILSGLSDRVFLFSDFSIIFLVSIFVFVLIGFSRLLIRYHRT